MKKGKPPASYRGLAQSIKGTKLSEKTVQKAITEAFKKGLISVVAAKSLEYRREHALEEQLLERFRDLQMAIVISTDNKEDVHKSLGHALAQQIHESKFMFRAGDIIGLGTGRGIHYTIENLVDLTQVPVENITIMSLTGSLFPQGVSNNLDYLLDADTNAALFTKHFRGLIQVRPISYPIAHQEAARKILTKETWLSPDEYAAHTPTLAIIGLGVLTGNNRLVQEVQRPADAKSPVLKPVYTYLQSIITEVESIKKEYNGYCAVGDCCNRLFIIPPPADINERIIPRLKKTLKPLIDTVNECTITATEEQLRMIKNVILVAGGSEKASGILCVLTKESGNISGILQEVPRIDGICIDKESAEFILQRPDNNA